jgi:tetratricopeptide (TPR) repeat protein
LKRKTAKANSNSPALRKRVTRIGLSVIVVAVLLAAFFTLRPPGVPNDPRAGSISPKATPSDESQAPARQEQALRAEQLEAAQKLVARFPQNDDTVYLLGLVQNEQGDSASATIQWERSLALDPSRADANESLGYALLLKDDYEGAEKYLRRALQLEPTLVSARFRLATTLVHQGQLREALSVFEGAPTNAFTVEMHRLRGEAHHQLKEYEKAKLSYEAALQLNPELPEAHYALSKVFVQLGEQEKAARYFAKFSALKARGDAKARDTRSNYDTLSITRESVARTHTDVGRVYMRHGLPHEAEELWMRAGALDGSNVLCRLQVAVLFQQRQHYAEALRFYEEVARLDPADALVHLNIGRVSLKLSQLPRAERAFKEVARLAPDRPEGHDGLAQVHAMKNAGFR